MNTFDDYFKKRIKLIKSCAKANNVTLEAELKNIFNKTFSEFEEMERKSYTTESCHSFWRRECENKGKMCHQCCHNFSISEYDNMTKAEKSRLGLS